MSGEQTGEARTEDPSPKRLKDLRKKNTVLRSPEFTQSVALVTLVAVAPMLFSALVSSSSLLMVRALSEAGELDVPGALNLAWEGLWEVLLATAVPVGLVLLSVAGTGALLTKARPNFYAVKPRPDLLKPKVGLKRVLGVTGLLEAGKGVLKLAAVAVVAATVLPAAYAAFLAGPPSVGDFVREVAGYASPLAWRIALLGLVIGIIDLIISRRRFQKQSRMTKSEVRREQKSNEGDPLFRALRRQRAAQMSRNRMISDVSSATVVVTNPTHIAVALRYAEGDPAPLVVARGAGVLAGKIKEKAFSEGIPVREDKPLARSLYRACRVGDSIPVELYTAVAAVLAAVLSSRGGRR